MLTVDGLASGLDTQSIIDGLLSIQQQQIDRVESRKQTIIARQTAFRGVEAGLLNLQSRISALSRARGVFEAKTARSSHEEIVVAAASSNASPGVFEIQVTQLARAHQITSNRFADEDTTINQGTFGIQVGDGPVSTVTIDSTNNTARGFAEAINSSNTGVTATIINDGSSDSLPYQILLTSKRSGSGGRISLTNDIDPQGGGYRPNFKLKNVVQAPTDAAITIGSGPGAIQVTSGNNQIDDVIPGVTLDLRRAEAGTAVTVAVENDTASIETGIRDFVEAYNDLMDFINEQSRYDAETGQAGQLLGDRSVITIQDEIQRAVIGVVEGGTRSTSIDGGNGNADVGRGRYNRLSAIGIRPESSGRLSINSAKLQAALSGPDAATFAELRQLFALDGESDSGRVQFVLGGTRTRPSVSGYGIDVTQAPSRARIEATHVTSNRIHINEVNNTLRVRVDGQDSGELTLADGTYDIEELASHVEAAINGSPRFNGKSVAVSVNQSGLLAITSDAYGRISEVAIEGGSAVPTLGFFGHEAATGLDVAGGFIVDGEFESASGTGRLLIGESDNANTAGLQVRVSLTGGELQQGVDATIHVTRGIAGRLEQVIESLLDPSGGRVQSALDQFSQRTQLIDDSIDQLNERFDARRDALQRQFAALESTVSQLQSTGSFLTAQLTSLRTLNS